IGTVIVSLRDMSLSVPGEASVSISNFETHLSLFSLLAGTVRPVEIDVRGMSVDVAHTLKSSHLTGSRADHVRYAVASSLTAFARLEGRLLERGLQRIGLADFEIQGRIFAGTPLAENLPLRIADMDWRVAETGSRIAIRFDSDQGEWVLDAETGALSEKRIYADVTISGFPPAFLFSRLTDPGKRPNYDAKAALNGRIIASSDGAFENAKARIAFGTGHLALLQKDRLALDSVEAAFELAATGSELKLVTGAIQSGGNGVEFAGDFDLDEFGRPLTFSAKMLKSHLPGLAEGDESVQIDSGYARGSIDPAGGAIVLERAFVTGPEGAVALNGAFRAQGDDAGLSGILQIEESTARMVYALWPPFVARQARNWYRANVRTGLAGPGLMRIALPRDHLGPQGRGKALPPDGLTGAIPFRFGEFSPTPDFPLVRHASGYIRFEDAALMASLHEADVQAAGFGSADVRQTFFRVPNLGRPEAVGYIDLRVSGPVSALALLSNSGPLNIAADRGLEPKNLTGNGQLDLFVEIPLGNRLSRDDVHADFELQLADFASSEPLDSGRRISHADLAVTGTLDTYAVAGDAVIDGIPARIDIESARKDFPSTVRLTLHEEAQRRLGMNLAPFLSGPIIAHVDPEAKDFRKVSLDLTPTDINLPFLGWHKLPGVAAQFTAYMEKSDYGLQFSRVRLSGEGFSASGEFAIDASGALADLSARNIQLRPDERFSISARRTSGRFKAQVSGEAIDVRGIISALQHPAGEGSEVASRIDITVNVDRLIGHNGVEISNIDGKASIVGGTVDTLSILAGPDGSHSIEVAADDETGGRKMVARFSDAGTILRFANVYRTAYGGGMTMEFTSPPETEDGKGHIGISGFRVREGGRNIAVRRLSIPFNRHDQTINIFEATMVAQGLDASARGAINLQSRYMSIRGTIVPTNGLNRLPASIPILGDLLGARKRKGLIGIAFTLAGPLSSPALKLNVASAVTPGFVRKMFGK
ncbi:MAG TPA: DUF3971 domain-containing protein, partial [Afifellaceae bacterium]|nr:DUF3971 domain-containing protein [Afifellaceae bacterium]